MNKKLSTYEAHKRYYAPLDNMTKNQLTLCNAGFLVSEIQEYIKNVTGKDISEEQLLNDTWQTDSASRVHIEYSGYRFILTWRHDDSCFIEYERV